MKLRYVGCLATVVFCGGLGCSPAPPASGRVEVLARGAAALSVSDVAGVTVTVSGTNISPSITSDLASGSAGWHGTIADIPPGTADFHGDAFDGSHTIIYAGDSPNVDVIAGQTAVVGLLMQQTQAPMAFHDNAPIIDSFSASANVVAPGGEVRVGGGAHQPGGGALTYSWTANDGSFASGSSASTTWTAPTTPGTYSLTFHAADGDGLTAAVTFTLSVQNGDAEVTTTFNTWPTVGNMTASPTRIDVGDTTSLSAAAADADGDTLSYAWTSDCSGTFSTPSDASTDFTLSALPPSGSCTFTSAVSDGRGGSSSGSVTLQGGAAPSLLVCSVNGSGATVDQSEYGDVGQGDIGWYIVLASFQSVSNTLTVGTPGVLTGIEVRVDSCRGTPLTGANVNMEIFDGSDASLGVVSVPASSFASACAGPVLTPDATGPGLFDVSSLCLSVTAGEPLRYTLSVTGGTAATCDRDTRMCSNGSDRCMRDQDCEGSFNISYASCGGGACLVFKSFVE